MNNHKFEFLIVSITNSEFEILNKVYTINDEWEESKKLTNSFDILGLELLGTMEYSNGCFHKNNLIYYHPYILEDYVEKNYSKNLDEIFILCEKNIFDNYKNKIAIFGCPNKFSFISTYSFHITFNEIYGSLCDYTCDKKLLNIKQLDDILYMQYDV